MGYPGYGYGSPAYGGGYGGQSRLPVGPHGGLGLGLRVKRAGGVSPAARPPAKHCPRWS